MATRHICLMGSLMVAMALLMGVNVTQAQVSNAVEYVVGDAIGWTIPPNESYYSDWASTKRFSVGDQLLFKFSGSHSVAEVSEADYDNCTTDIFRLGTIVFEGSPNGAEITYSLNQTGSRYFICTVGDHCERGQKLSIDIDQSLSPTNQPPDSSAPTLSFRLLSGIFSSMGLYFMAYF